MNRLLTTAAVSLALCAWAGGGKEETVKSDKPLATGGATIAPEGAATPTTPPGPTTSTTTSTKVGEVKKEEKSWEVRVGSEFHRMWIQTDLNGAKANSNLLYWSISGRYSLTKADRISISFGVAERFLADQGETGLRNDDPRLLYSHDFGEVIGGVEAAASFSLNAPLSFYSQKMGLITAPGGAVEASRKFGPVMASLRASGGFFIQRYDSMEGGAPNPKGRLGFSADLNVDIPWVKGLALGVDAYTGYVWFYTPQGNPCTNGMYEGQCGTENSATYPVQPMLQSYGGEAYVRYSFPEWRGVKADVSLVLADGDPTLGYNSTLHDGIGYFYLYYRYTAAWYAALSVRY